MPARERRDRRRALRRQRRRRRARHASRSATRPREGRRLRFFTRVEDRPGGLARLLTRIAEAGGNLVTVTHVREAVPLHIRQTGVDLLLETRGADHAAEIVAALEQAGYEIERQSVGRA